MNRDLVVAGCSAGGLEALISLVGGLPQDFPAALLIVQHFPVNSESMLSAILDRSGPLPAAPARDGEKIERGRIYTAPPGTHLTIDDGRLRLSSGPRENGHRPAIDTLFRSAARGAGARVMGVVLSGTLDDGSLGLSLIKEHGGLAIVQAPDDALYPDMPKNAMATVSPDHVTTAEELGPLLNRLGHEPIPTEDLNRTAAARRGREPDTGSLATMLTCPECGGTVRVTELEGKELYHCHAGHSFTELSLETHQSTRVDSALSHAYRALVEHATILRRLAERSKAWGHGLVVDQMEERARDAEQRAVLIRRALSEQDPKD